MRPDWCCVTPNGAVAKSMRVEDGSFKAKEGKDGPFYLHRLADGSPPDGGHPGAPPPPAGPVPKRADADMLNAVYSALLDRLSLADAHRQALQGRGLTDEVIDRAGYRSLPVRG